MCKLIISSSGRLHAPAILHIKPNPPYWQQAITENITFLVDTGADVTCLSALDAERLEIYTDVLEEAGYITGITGKVMSYKLPNVTISFIDEITDDYIQHHIEEIDCIRVVKLPEDKKETQEGTNTERYGEPKKVFGLLGLDILQYFDLSTNREDGLAYLKRITLDQGKHRISRTPMFGTNP